ncbi:SRPBCC domain-containing protein [Rhizobium sp. S152]|uniref:SRPBCC family protein n=1 Tax=Rhizobium sp. S152 TaxID=3055038 RepID=UPI0025A9D073|nr:SRPBCC domain-containing protein [Rhizobium sp. S152]MDM9629823.1 SRPBCC domain-containing protein [Rhizobium sp. S152]
MTELELTVNRKIAASRDKVFDAWLSPTMLAQFMRIPTDSTGPSRVENDPVKGGRFSIVMLTPDREVPHAGTYLEIDPHSRLSFTWESPHSLDDSVVTIDFAEAGPDSTEITLKQVKFRSEQARDGHIKGWTAILGGLEQSFAHA